MIIQHNLLAMNGNRMLGINTRKKDKAMEKLSSGYKINRSADDASGLAISEKMRKQIRGLTQASANAQDGISLIQTAEGAMAEIADMVNRIEEMAVHAANGTLAESDRDAIDKEFRQLKTEIDRVKATTKFNELYTLGGRDDLWAAGSTVPTHEEANNFFKSTYDGSLTGKNGSLFEMSEGGVITCEFNIDPDRGGAFNLPVYLMHPPMGAKIEADFDADPTNPAKQLMFDKVSNTYVHFKGVQHEVGNTLTFYYIIDDVYKGAAFDPRVQSDATFTKEEVKDLLNGLYSTLTTTPDPTVTQDQAYNFVDNLQELFELLNEKNLFTMDDRYLKDFGVVEDGNGGARLSITTFEDPPNPFLVDLHVGADATSNNQITLSIDSLSTRALRLNDVDLRTQENALKTINRVEYANKRVSDARAKLGAEQNRLEHTIKNLDNVIENTQAAESIIRDTDMAREMVEYSKQQILEQAGQSVLAQAQQSNQGVLTLLG